ncbi:TlpA family protein disulfide reductase [Paenibacillus septentrionalis]|uniref:TlpA family protein disulfide reductase n=1 Tax=Paenibacillus septentrionalis TaxID=429342 RepID=A0ABW1VAS8_9BACL
MYDNSFSQKFYRRTRKLLQLAIVILTIVGIAVVVWFQAQSASKRPDIVKVGDKLPQIELLQLDGAPVTLDAATNGAMLINLWASWCKPCINELPLLNDAQAFAPNVSFVAVNMQEELERIKPMIERYDLTMQVLRDEQLAWKRALGVQGYPVSVLVDANGIIQHIHVGAYTEIEEILAHTAKLASMMQDE